MDRVGFLVEESGERLGCLLNPESLEITRVAGVRPRRSAGGLLTGKGLKDDPLLFTGGGTTQLKLDLLFDVSLGGSSIQTENVLDLTRPLWQLAENQVDEQGLGRLPLVRFFWGKSWNIPCVISAIAERFEDFTTGGTPRRSWMRLGLLRVENPEALAPKPGMAEISPSGALGEHSLLPTDLAPERVRTHEVVGGQDRAGQELVSGERLDTLAHEAYGDASQWRILAVFNQIDDPLRIAAGHVLQIPSLERSGAR